MIWRRNRTAILVVAGATALFMTALAMAAPQPVVGTIFFNLDIADIGYTITVSVSDGDENKPALQQNETAGNSGSAAYDAPPIGSSTTLIPNKRAVLDWVPITLDDVDSIVSAVAAFGSRADFFDATGVGPGTDVERLADTNGRDDNALSFNDVTVAHRVLRSRV